MNFDELSLTELKTLRDLQAERLTKLTTPHRYCGYAAEEAERNLLFFQKIIDDRMDKLLLSNSCLK